MSRIIIADLNSNQQISELSEAELTTTKGGHFRSCGGGFRRGEGGCGSYGGSSWGNHHHEGYWGRSGSCGGTSGGSGNQP